MGEDGSQKAAYITKDDLGLPSNLMIESQSDWKFELKDNDWRSYPPEDCTELDRYWKVFDAPATEAGSDAPKPVRPYLARVNLMRKETIVDFKAMTCQVGGSRPRKLKREVVDDGWLTNAFFFKTFTAVLAEADVKIDNKPEDMFDFRYNQDFRTRTDDGRKMKRGGHDYKIPVGWKRFAVNVKGQYDDGNNHWLKEDETGWAVAYHGTAKESLPGILSTGFRVGAKQKFEANTGAGIYCAAEIDVSQYYSEPQYVDGHWIQTVLQMRVKPSAIKKVTSSSATAFEKKYWVINDPGDMRAYGVLMREFSLFDYKPPQYAFLGAGSIVVKNMLDELRQKAERIESGDLTASGRSLDKVPAAAGQQGGCCSVL